MSSTVKITTSLLAVIGAIVAVFLQIISPILEPSGSPPPEYLLPFFGGLTVLNGIAMGIAVAFIIFGLPKIGKVNPKHQFKLMMVFVSITWALISWWIHDYLHIAEFGASQEGLATLEYAFHVTVEVAGSIAAIGFYSILRDELSTSKVDNPKLFGLELNGTKLFSLIFVVIGIPSFFLGPIILPSSFGDPPAYLLPHFMFFGVMDSLALSVGLTFTILYLRQLREVHDSVQNRAFAVFIGLAWSLLSWWPHTRLHLNIGFDWLGILFLDYGFHLTQQAAFYMAAYAFMSLISNELSARSE